MIFKTLVLQGFKSFPDKTEIHFSSGITAIVGPNGSGKSNISDAIRWVLGEQSSRSLRGAKMEDVIFGGTKKRSAVGFAEVSLVLNNETAVFSMDATEIMITRRYYRTGDSEYYINKRHCRLRDIHELFMDTGIGRDGYSIIGQGRIDEILSVKSEDRRDVFEEAAGISKFRYRKEESTRKLAQTEENLVRIRDIYSQMEEQYAPLQKQAKKAEQYLVLRDELRLLEITLWLQQLEQLCTDTAQAQVECATIADQLTKAQTAQTTLYAQQDALTADLQACDCQAEQLRQAVTHLEEERANHAQEVAVLRTQITNAQDNIARAEQSKQQREIQVQSLERQQQVQKAQLERLDSEYQDHLQTIASMQADHAQGAKHLADLTAQWQTAQVEQQACAEKKQTIALEHQTAQTALAGMDDRQLTIATDTAQAAEHLAQAEVRAKATAQELTDNTQRLSMMHNRFTGLSMKQASRQSKLDTTTQALNQATRAKADHQQRLRLLTELQRDYDGYARSVKTMMQLRDRGQLQGIHGTVTSLIAVKDAYITAIETALGATASHIVVDSTAVGKTCLQHLKRTDGGRATFLPLDTIRANQLQEKNLHDYTGFRGTADSLVASDAVYRPIVQNLLARTVIMEDMNTALNLAKATRNRFRIVTLDGQVLQVGGAMTGGSVGKSSGILARNAQIAQLQAQTEALSQAEQQAEQQQLTAKRELLALEDDLHALQAEQVQIRERVSGLEAMQVQQNDLLAHLRITHENLARERDTVDTAKQGYQDALTRTQAQLAQQDMLLSAHEVQVERLQEQVTTQTDRQQAALLTLTKATADGQANRQSHVATENALQSLSKLHAEMQAGFAGDTANMAQFNQRITDLQTQLAEREHMHAQTEQARLDLQQQLQAQLTQRARIEGERTHVQKQEQVQNQEILQLERDQSQHTQKLAQCKQQETALLDKLWETYELTPTPAREFIIPIESRKQAEEQVRTLRQQIRGLGNVNLDAVAEFAELSEKYHFLGEQKQDLETAGAELEKMIAQLTKQMEQIFLEQFTLLNQHFGETFTEMFGGGSASLLLTDPKDILGCGIDIRVAPPGKTVKTITLLSGGERAFVAIALYFAILKVRPTPFCVLDEIEAALDDVNVTRYAQYLRTLMDKTQFIVITHRRGTMEEADMLYGVTMQEQGVSRMLMLNLAQAIDTL